MPKLNVARFVARLRNTAPPPMRDWPQQLRLNSAAARLAPTLYAAHVEMRSFGAVPWADLQPLDRQRWIARAANALRE